MSHRKRIYRDKKDEVLAESEKLRKDIENLENALALHTRYQVEDNESIKGLIRQEIQGSRWEYGAEGKLTTFRSAQDLQSDSSGNQRVLNLSGRQSSRDKGKQRSSREQDKAKKTGKEKNYNKKENVQNVGEEKDFPSLEVEQSIENIARLINSAKYVSNISEKSHEVGRRKDVLTDASQPTPNELKTTELDDLKSKVLARASVNMIQRNPRISSSLRKTKSVSEDIESKLVEKRTLSANESWKSIRTVGRTNKPSDQSTALQRNSHTSTIHKSSDKLVGPRDNLKTIHTGLKEIKDTNGNTLQRSSSARKEKLSEEERPQTINKTFSEQPNIKDENSLTKNHVSPEMRRPLSRSQSSKLNLLSNLYGEHGHAGDELLKMSDLKSSLHREIALDLASQKSTELQNLTSIKSSRKKEKGFDDTYSPLKSERSIQLSAFSSVKNHGNLRELPSNQDPICDPQVKEWLNGLDLQSSGQYEALFAKHQMDMASVLLLTPESLREMGIQALGPIMKMMKGVHILNRDKSTEDNAKHSVNDNQYKDFINHDKDQLRNTRDQTTLPKDFGINAKSFVPSSSQPSSESLQKEKAADSLKQKEIDTSPSVRICWEESSVPSGLKSVQESLPAKNEARYEIAEDLQTERRPLAGKRFKIIASPKKKETRQKITNKPPLRTQGTGKGSSSASLRTSSRQKGQQEAEGDKLESSLQQKTKTSSTHRNKGSCPTQGSQRQSLHRSSSFTEGRQAKLKSPAPTEHSYDLKGIVTGRGLKTKLSINRPKKPQDQSFSHACSDTADEIGNILSALQDLPSHVAASEMSSTRPRKPQSKSQLHGNDVSVTLGAVRELQTRLSCLEEHLTVKTSDSKNAKVVEHLRLGLLDSEALAICEEETSKSSQDGDETSCQIKVMINKKEKKIKAEHPKEKMFTSAEQREDASGISTQTNEVDSSPETSICKSTQEMDFEFSQTQPVKEYAANSPAKIDDTTAKSIKQEKGHYFGMRKRGHNFQLLEQPREFGVSYQKEAFKGLELDKEDISFSENNLCGEGPFSKVFRGTFKGSEVAIKRLKVPLLPRDKNYFKAEVSMLNELRHSCFVELLGFCNTDNLPLIVLEYMACGNLDSLLHDKSRPDLSVAEFYQICHDVSSALAYLHGHQPPVFHLDLKPRNVLLSHGNRAKVADFGFSKLKHEADMKVSRVSKSQMIHSAPLWMAPELLAAREVTAKADVYSFGILLWEMFTREAPYAGCTVFEVKIRNARCSTNKKLENKVLEQVRLNQRPVIPGTCPHGLAGLIQLCWDQNPAARPNFKHILTTIKQLTETDTWSKLTEPVCDVASNQESTPAADGMDTTPGSDSINSKHQHFGEEMSRDIEYEKAEKIETSTLPKISQSLPIASDSKPDEVSAVMPAPTALELETQAGHTTLFVHAAPLSPPQTSEVEHAYFEQTQAMLSDESSVQMESRSSSIQNKLSPKQNSSSPSLSKEISLGPENQNAQDKNMNSAIGLKVKSEKNSIGCEGFSSKLNQTPHDDGHEAARDLIAKYLPTNKKSVPTVSKSHDQHFNSGHPKKLLPLRRSLNKLKSKSLQSTSSLVASTQVQTTGHPEICLKDMGELNTSEEPKPYSAGLHSVSMEKHRLSDQGVERKSHSNIRSLGKCVNPPYADGQPYVPSYYSEIQHASAGHKKTKPEYGSPSFVFKENNKQTSNKSGSNLKGMQMMPEYELEVQSDFMRSLNASASSPCVKRSQNLSAKCDELENLQERDKNGAIDKRIDSSVYFDNDLHSYKPVGFDFCEALNKNGNAISSPREVTEDDKAKISARKIDDQLADLRLNLMSPDLPNRDFKDGDKEDEDESCSVFSKRSSSSLTPDGISIDSLSLSDDGDTVVDSLDFVDDLANEEDGQNFSNKEALQDFTKDNKFRATHAKSKTDSKKSSQRDTRKSFFLFDDSEDSKPFDIINSIAIQGSSCTEIGETGTSTGQSFCRSSNARRRTREKKVADRTKEAGNEILSVKTLTKNETVLSSTTLHDKAAHSRENAVNHSLSLQAPPLQHRLSLTGDLLAKGKKLLKPSASRNERLANHKEKSQSHNPQNLLPFSVNASLLQIQKGQLKSVQTREPVPLKSVTHALLPINESGLPSMANILKKALDERRFAMGDNPESQEYTPEASWSLQDD
ncbi:protein kinase [Elysia marginata]|uniref:Protein kinase n=1 Tax=Elysia marginata TaxID=1093978 RepID=A0AAV4HJ22_9GAST|nr:protein kinase [Elysia marginata]